MGTGDGKMKRLIVFLLGMIIVLSFAACGRTAPDTPPETIANSQNKTNDTSDTEKRDDALASTDTSEIFGTEDTSGETQKSNKILVVYFSGSGNTKRVAENIADAAGGTLFELVPTEPYTSDDLSWTTEGSRVNREHDDESLRDIPLVTTTPENFDEYETVFIGYPIWWGIAAWPVNSFVKNNDFTGKTVIPFATSASSGMGQSGTLLSEMAGTGNWQDGQRFSSGADKSVVEDWVNDLNLVP